MKELVENVKQWGIDKGLDKVGHLAQAEYTLKETSELLDAYADKDIDAINDAIGDILVTLIVGASNDEVIYDEVSLFLEKARYSKFDLHFGIAYNSICHYGLMLEARGENVDHQLYISTIHAINKCLTWVNKNYNQSLSLKNCLQLAYDEIKNRTGKLNADGHFIKD